MELSSSRLRKILGRDVDDSRGIAIFWQTIVNPSRQSTRVRAECYGTSTQAKRSRASPMTYAVDGVQYVVVSAGSDVFSFSLPQ